MHRQSLLLSLLVGAIVIIVLVGVGVWVGANQQQSSSVDWDAVGQAMGKELENKGEGVYGAEFPRSDLTVTSEGVTLDPGMELGAEANFKDMGGGNALMIGEATLTEDELQPVIDKLLCVTKNDRRGRP